jgi:hypothetical protein
VLLRIGKSFISFKGGCIANQGREASGITESPAATAASTEIKIRWDDANMKSVYSNVCNVAGTGEEVVLLFGMNQSWHAGQKDIKIQLMDRIVMSPFAAKRLGVLLNQVLQDYETRYGKLDVGAPIRPDVSSVQ